MTGVPYMATATSVCTARVNAMGAASERSVVPEGAPAAREACEGDAAFSTTAWSGSTPAWAGRALRCDTPPAR